MHSSLSPIVAQPWKPWSLDKSDLIAWTKKKKVILQLSFAQIFPRVPWQLAFVYIVNFVVVIENGVFCTVTLDLAMQQYSAASVLWVAVASRTTDTATVKSKKVYSFLDE